MRKPECPEKTLKARLRSTETQSTYNICSRGGRCDRCALRQPGFPKKYSTGYFIYMITHPDINPVQQGFTAVNRWEPVFPFGDSRTTKYRYINIGIECFSSEFSNVYSSFFRLGPTNFPRPLFEFFNAELHYSTVKGTV